MLSPSTLRGQFRSAQDEARRSTKTQLELPSKSGKTSLIEFAAESPALRKSFVKHVRVEPIEHDAKVLLSMTSPISLDDHPDELSDYYSLRGIAYRSRYEKRGSAYGGLCDEQRAIADFRQALVLIQKMNIPRRR